MTPAHPLLAPAPFLAPDSPSRSARPTLTRRVGPAKWGEGVTVCIAAIADQTGLFVASDRMKTGGNIQYEPEVSKIVPLTTSIALLTAGDSQFNTEIINALRGWVSAHIQATPKVWISVRDVVDWYVWQRQELKRKAAEERLLHPLGLSSQSFLTQQATMNADLVQEISRNLVNFNVPTTEVIIAGIDATGTHIYTVVDGYIANHSTVGFATIGVGSWHVESQFMLSGHHPRRSIPETVSLVYRAKRRAEAAPGVGQATDMAMIIQGLGSYKPVGDHIQDKLRDLYDRMQKQQERARNRVHQELESYVRKLLEAQQTPPTQESDGPDGFVDGSGPGPAPFPASGAAASPSSEDGQVD